MTDQLRLRVTIDVLFNLNDTKRSYLMNNMEQVARHAASNGMFTADSEAEVEEWDMTVVELPANSEKPEDWFTTEILLHDVQWHYGKAEGAPQLLSSGDEDHIRHSILEGYREGMLTYEGTDAKGDDFTHRGWWRIKK